VPSGAVTQIVPRADHQRLVVGTSTGTVLQLDANSLKVNRTELTVNARVTALLPIGVSELIVGDSQGRLTLKNGAERVQVDQDGSPIAGLAYINGEVWSAAGKTIAVYKRDGNKLVEQSKYPTLSNNISCLVSSGNYVFGVIGDKLYSMSPQGPGPKGVELTFPVVGHSFDDSLVVAITSSGVTLFDPKTLEPVATSGLDRKQTILSIGPGGEPGSFYLGTRSGEVYQCTYD
jgi:hypothetical protein